MIRCGALPSKASYWIRLLILVVAAALQLPAAAPARIGTGETGRYLSAESGVTTGLQLGSVQITIAGSDFGLTANGRSYSGKAFRRKSVRAQSGGAVVELTSDDL